MTAVLSITGDVFIMQAAYGDTVILVHKQLVRICIGCPFVLDYCMRNYRRVAHMLPPHHVQVFSVSHSEPKHSLLIFPRTVFQAATTNQLLLT